MTIKRTALLMRCVCLGLAASAITAIYAGPQGNRSAAIHPIIDKDGELLGATRGGTWIPQDKAAHLMMGGETYQVYDSSSVIGAVRGGKPESMDEPCPSQMVIPVKMPAGAVIGISSPWNAMSRKARVEDTKQPVYVAAVRKVLVENGIKKPDVHIDQIYRCDLDNDGSDEVLISAHRYFELGGGHTSTRAGDYSLVMLRQVSRSGVKTQLLEADFYPKAAPFAASMTYHINGFYDLMGDQRLQIVIGWKYYEGAGTDILSVRGLQVEKVLGDGCGA